MVNIEFSAANRGDLPSAMQRATWSACNFTLAIMLISGFSVGSAIGPSEAPKVVFAGGAVMLLANTTYAVRRILLPNAGGEGWIVIAERELAEPRDSK